MAQDTTQLRRLIKDERGTCCDAALTERLDELKALSDGTKSSFERDVAALKALGNETRYEIVRLLTAADRELCVCEFSPLLSVSESAVSHALRGLTDAGLVSRRKEGTWRYYQPTPLAERLLSALDGSRGEQE
ncbi:metalloregulator ArsR/SmtB family transcription factor [Haladaptatus sp. DYSN1]|uniref:ArsR/SmtB family transcription factor n=1 Tax=unclassified Haladaptatus TaxID=2622732 RepID=UPI002404A482|nr:metalloregulator ArsR/SmtB family transcription factor [Haladaptatus sp. DYSN1]